MASEQINLAELELRVRRPERWAPTLPDSGMALRLRCKIRDASFAWVAAHAPGGKTAVVREAVVKGAALVKALRAPARMADLLEEDLVRVKDQAVSPQFVTDLLKSAAAFTIPIVGRVPNQVLDGRTYAVSIDSGAASVELTWTESGFPEWRPLAEWAEATRRRLHEMVFPGAPLAE